MEATASSRARMPGILVWRPPPVQASLVQSAPYHTVQLSTEVGCVSMDTSRVNVRQAQGFIQ